MIFDTYIYSASSALQSVLVDSVGQTEIPVIQSIPNQEVYSSAIQVTITCATPGAEIYYTLDGSIPTTSSPIYSTAITLTRTTNVKAIAKLDVLAQSDEAVRAFVVYTLEPYQYSLSSTIETVNISRSISVEFTTTSPSIQNVRSIFATVRVFNDIDNTDNIDATDEYYFSCVADGELDIWIFNSDANFQLNNPDTLIPAGTMEKDYILKAKVVRASISAEFVTPGYKITIDEVAPITTAITPSGAYSTVPLTIVVGVEDFTDVVTYYTINGDNPDTSSSIYAAPGIVLSETDTPIFVKYFSIDAAGNIETPDWDSGENVVEFVLNTISPVVTIINVSKPILLVGEVCDVSWSLNKKCQEVIVEQGGGGVLGNGTVISTVGITEQDIVQNLQIPASNLPTGETEIYFYATDYGNNVGMANITLTFDNQVPVIDIFEVCRHTVSSEETATIIWKTTVDGDFVIRLGGSNPIEGVLIASGSAEYNKIIETEISASQLQNNILNDIRLYVTSVGGNTGFSSVNMSVDTMAPVSIPNVLAKTGPFLEPFSLRVDAVDTIPDNVATDWYNSNLSVPMMENSIYSFPGNYQDITTETNLGDAYIYSDPSAVGLLTIEPKIDLSVPIVSELGTVAATINWTTLLPSDSVLEYSSTDPLLSTFATLSDSIFVTGHAIIMSGLDADTTYYFRVRSSNLTLTETSTILTLTTNAVIDTISPTITGLLGTAVNTTSIRIDWQTDEIASSIVLVSEDASFTSPIEHSALDTDPLVSSHSYLINGLEIDTEYWFKAKSLDAADNETVSSIVSARTLGEAALGVANIVVKPYRTTCIIKWTTNVPTTGNVNYGTTNSYGLATNDLDVAKRTQHEVILTGLTPERTYFFEITGIDIANNPVTSAEQTLVTQSNRDRRIVIYATIDGSVPSTSHFDYRTIGNPLILLIDTDTLLQYFAVDGFGNQEAIQTQVYTFDNVAPVVTVDWMEPILLGTTGSSVLRFKVDEAARYRVTNQVNTLLASNGEVEESFYSLFAVDAAGHVSEPVSAVVGGGFLEAETWAEVEISSSVLEEGYNHISIEATDQYGNSSTLLIGHIIKDSIAPIVEPSIAAGYYNSEFYVNLIPQNLRDDEEISIYYTTDGTLPTFNSDVGHGQVYNILISNTTTLRWFGVDEAGNIEPPKYATYVLDRQAPIVYATPLPGDYDEIIEVELKTNEPGFIFYTLNETVPVDPINAHTLIYNTPIQILQDTIITCFAKDLAGNVSSIKTFIYAISVLQDKKFKKVIGFQDKMLLETEFNEAQDNINRRIEELAREVVGHTGIVFGYDIIPSVFPGSFEFYLREGKSYIAGKFVTIARSAQSFIASVVEIPGDKTYHIIISPEEPIFRPTRPGHPGWEEGVPEITTYRLEEGYIIRVIEDFPDMMLDPYIELYEVFRPFNATSIADCIIIDKRKKFEPMVDFQENIGNAVDDIRANMLAMGLEIESYKLRNLLGLKNAFIDTFESTKNVDLSKSEGYRYTKTRFEL